MADATLALETLQQASVGLSQADKQIKHLRVQTAELRSRLASEYSEHQCQQAELKSKENELSTQLYQTKDELDETQHKLSEAVKGKEKAEKDRDAITRFVHEARKNCREAEEKATTQAVKIQELRESLGEQTEATRRVKQQMEIALSQVSTGHRTPAPLQPATSVHRARMSPRVLYFRWRTQTAVAVAARRLRRNCCRS